MAAPAAAPDAPSSAAATAATAGANGSAPAAAQGPSAEAKHSSTKRAQIAAPDDLDSLSFAERPDSPRIVRLTLKAHERAEAADVLDRLAPQLLEFRVEALESSQPAPASSEADPTESRTQQDAPSQEQAEPPLDHGRHSAVASACRADSARGRAEHGAPPDDV